MADAAMKQSVSMNALYIEITFQSESLSKDGALAQTALLNLVNNNQEMSNFFSGKSTDGSFSLGDLGYDGKPILELGHDEASALLADDLSLLQEGRKGIVQGFEEAEKLWGAKLPDIAYETQEKTLQKIDETIASLGGNVLNLAA